MPRVEGHLLDETQLVTVVHREDQEVGCLVVVDPAQLQRVQFHRVQPRGIRRRDPGQDIGEPVAAGELVET